MHIYGLEMKFETIQEYDFIHVLVSVFLIFNFQFAYFKILTTFNFHHWSLDASKTSEDILFIALNNLSELHLHW